MKAKQPNMDKCILIKMKCFMVMFVGQCDD